MSKKNKKVLSLPNIENDSTAGNKYESGVTIEKIDMKKSYNIDMKNDKHAFDTRTDFARFVNKGKGAKQLFMRPRSRL